MPDMNTASKLFQMGCSSYSEHGVFLNVHTHFWRNDRGNDDEQDPCVSVLLSPIACYLIISMSHRCAEVGEASLGDVMRAVVMVVRGLKQMGVVLNPTKDA